MNDLKGTLKNLKKDRNRKKSRSSNDSNLSLNNNNNNKSEDEKDDDNKSVTSQDSVDIPKKKPTFMQSLVTSTQIEFIEVDGTRTKHDCGKRILSYSELQSEIARFFKKQGKLHEMCVVQNSKREKVFPENFMPSDLIFVRKILTKPPSLSTGLKRLSNYWEGEDYHDAAYQEKLKQQGKKSVSLYF
jgi:hypothetical protein